MKTSLRNTVLTSFLVFLLCISMRPVQAKEYLVLNNADYTPGMFSAFLTILGCLDYYEQGDYAGLKVFKTKVFTMILKQAIIGGNITSNHSLLETRRGL